MTSRNRAGTTLVELLIVVVLMSLLAGVATLAFSSVRQDNRHTINDTVNDSVRASSSDARPRIVYAGDSFSAFVLPDGRILADTVFHVDPFTRRAPHAR